MSKEGLPEISVTGKGRKVAVIAAQWYGKVTDALTERASQTLEEAVRRRRATRRFRVP